MPYGKKSPARKYSDTFIPDKPRRLTDTDSLEFRQAESMFYDHARKVDSGRKIRVIRIIK